jgi:uncharacterized protein YjhX (UPF0386 family)
MKPKQVTLFNAYMKIVKNNCIMLAKHNKISIQEDEAGNIWISEDGIECFKVRGWHTAMNEVEKIVKRKELRAIENAR